MTQTQYPSPRRSPFPARDTRRHSMTAHPTSDDTGGCVEDPPAFGFRPPLAPAQFALTTVGVFGTVVVTAHSPIHWANRQLLDRLLTDLIGDPANLTVTVDLASATLDPEQHLMFIIAACRARRRGTRFIVKHPSADTGRALQEHELGDLVEILPRLPLPTPAARNDPTTPPK
jgi:hypothetical protein